MLRYAQVTVDGHPIDYATEGNGPPLLLIPGLPLDHQVWAPTIPYLSGRFRVVAPDLPGSGRSRATPADSSPDGVIHLIAGLTTALRMVPCAVAGISFGAAIGFGLAIRHPERVRALAAIGSPGAQIWPEGAQARLARATRNVPGMTALGMRLAPRALSRWFIRTGLNDRQLASDDLIEQTAATLRARSGRRAIVGALRHLDDWRFVLRRLGAIRAPTLLVWGEHDAYYGLPAAERLRHAIPGARLVTLAGAGHLLPIERPVELAAQIRPFLLRKS